MSHSLRDLAAQTASVERMVEFARTQTDAVNRLAHEHADLDSYGDNAVADATARYGTAMREHLELAVRYGEEWWRAVNEVLSRSAARSQ